MSRVFVRVRTEAGPRTQVFSMAEVDARLLADRLHCDEAGHDGAKVIPGIVILPDAGPYLTVAQMVGGHMKVLDKEISRKRRRKPTVVQLRKAKG
jgi:hypothetical protein